MGDHISIEALSIADQADGEALGRLMTELSERNGGSLIPVERLQAIVNSPDQDQFVARLHGRIVGAATMSLIGGVLGSKGWLEDFVVSSDEAIRGKGVGYALWQEIIHWCEARNVPLTFTSNENRQDAHRFYFRQGAKIVATTVFKVETANS